jgi:hypothetical protein
LHDTNETANGVVVFDRRSSELHHYDIIVSFKSALSLESAHDLLLELFWRQKKNPPPDRFWRWVRVICLRLLYFIRSRPPEDT